MTMPILRRYVDSMLEVSEEEISEAMVRLLEDSKLVAEGAGAVGIAALLAGRVPKRLSRVCVVISGGNIDLNMMPGPQRFQVILDHKPHLGIQVLGQAPDSPHPMTIPISGWKMSAAIVQRPCPSRFHTRT